MSTVTAGTVVGVGPSKEDFPHRYSLGSCWDSVQLMTKTYHMMVVVKYYLLKLQDKVSNTHREHRGCRCWGTTAALWSAGQVGLESGDDLDMNPGRFWPHQDAGLSGRAAAVAAVSLAEPGPADAGAVGSAAACY